MKNIQEIVFSKDGESILVISEDDDNQKRKLEIWNVKTGKLLKTTSIDGKKTKLDKLVFKKYDKYLVSWSKIPSLMISLPIRIWHQETGELLNKNIHLKNDAIILSKDKKNIIHSTKQNPVRIWDIENDKLIHSLEDTRAHLQAVRLAQDGSIISWYRNNKTIRIWNLKERKTMKLNTSVDLNSWGSGISLSEDEKKLFIWDKKKPIQMWDTKMGKMIHTFGGV